MLFCFCVFLEIISKIIMDIFDSYRGVTILFILVEYHFNTSLGVFNLRNDYLAVFHEQAWLYRASTFYLSLFVLTLYLN